MSTFIFATVVLTTKLMVTAIQDIFLIEESLQTFLGENLYFSHQDQQVTQTIKQ